MRRFLTPHLNSQPGVFLCRAARVVLGSSRAGATRGLSLGWAVLGQPGLPLVLWMGSQAALARLERPGARCCSWPCRAPQSTPARGDRGGCGSSVLGTELNLGYLPCPPLGRHKEQQPVAGLGPAQHAPGTGARSSSVGWSRDSPAAALPASYRCLRCALAAGPAGAVRHLGGSPIPAGSTPAVTPLPSLSQLLAPGSPGRSPPALGRAAAAPRSSDQGTS